MEQTKSEIRSLKVTSPHIFPEWRRLQDSVQKLREAYREVAEAQKAWDNLGEKDA